MTIIASCYSGTHKIVVHYSHLSGRYRITYDGQTMINSFGRAHSFQAIEDGQNSQYAIKITGWTVFTQKAQVIRNGILIFSPEEGFRPPISLLPTQSQDLPKETIVREKIILVVCPHCGHRNDASRRTCEKCEASI
ncbi:MAG: zinc finger Ran-binding domain-containing protein [Candidatus Thorarchaeota archaeon]|nr:zinc finger Ran-binding domain-containing protein [Candidatus Thorarchaeota archaeon]